MPDGSVSPVTIESFIIENLFQLGQIGLLLAFMGYVWWQERKERLSLQEKYDAAVKSHADNLTAVLKEAADKYAGNLVKQGEIEKEWILAVQGISEALHEVSEKMEIIQPILDDYLERRRDRDRSRRE